MILNPTQAAAVLDSGVDELTALADRVIFDESALTGLPVETSCAVTDAFVALRRALMAAAKAQHRAARFAPAV